MSEMTLPFRHKIRNSNPEGLRPSTLPLGHRDSPRVDGEETFLFSVQQAGVWALNISERQAGPAINMLNQVVLCYHRNHLEAWSLHKHNIIII